MPLKEKNKVLALLVYHMIKEGVRLHNKFEDEKIDFILDIEDCLNAIGDVEFIESFIAAVVADMPKAQGGDKGK